MQVFFNRAKHKYCSNLKDDILKNKLFFILQTVIIFVAILLGLFISIKNNGNCGISKIFDGTLYRFICNDINFFQFFLKKIIYILFLYVLIMLCFCNKKTSYISYLIVFYFTFLVFYDLVLIIKCFSLIGFIFGIVCFLLFNLIILLSIYLLQIILFRKVNCQCNCLDFNYDFKNILLLFGLISAVVFVQSILLLIFFPFINAFV